MICVIVLHHQVGPDMFSTVCIYMEMGRGRVDSYIAADYKHVTFKVNGIEVDSCHVISTKTSQDHLDFLKPYASQFGMEPVNHSKLHQRKHNVLEITWETLSLH